MPININLQILALAGKLVDHKYFHRKSEVYTKEQGGNASGNVTNVTFSSEYSFRLSTLTRSNLKWRTMDYKIKEIE